MEFLKHELNSFQNELPNDESGIRRGALQFMCSPIFQQEELEEITRQRLIFTAILLDHSNVLFGTSIERGPIWEEIRQFMIEQGASTLNDKDWKYVAGCYWQNIRKDSIRRMARMRVGSISKPLRPGMIELDRLVGEVVNKKGSAGSTGSATLETLISNYARNYTDEEEPAGSNEGEQANNEVDTANHLDEESTNLAVAAGDGRILHPAISSHQNQVVIVDYRPNRINSTKISQNHPSTSTSNATNRQKRFLAPSSSSKPPADYQLPQETKINKLSLQLGNSIAKTHSQLVASGYLEMAMEFERHLKQMVNGYKAWMFDQIFGQDNVNVDEIDESEGPPEAKIAKFDKL